MFVDRDQRISNIWTASPIRPYHLRRGPRSAFARLFPEQYRREQEILRQQCSLLANGRSLAGLSSVAAQCFSDEGHLTDCYGKMKHSRVTFSTTTTTKEDYGVLTKSEPHLAAASTKDIECHKGCSSYPRPKLIYQVGPYRLLFIPSVDGRHLRPFSETISKESIRSTPRRVVNQRLPPLSTRPRSVIFDKWLSYKAKAKPTDSLPLSHATAESHYDVPRVYDDETEP